LLQTLTCGLIQLLLKAWICNCVCFIWYGLTWYEMK